MDDDFLAPIGNLDAAINASAVRSDADSAAALRLRKPLTVLDLSPLFRSV